MELATLVYFFFPTGSKVYEEVQVSITMVSCPQPWNFGLVLLADSPSTLKILK
jgi:hypothetical protein